MRRIPLYFDRKRGETFYLGMNSIVQHRTVHLRYQEGVERYLGPGARRIVYNASKNIARKRFCEMVRGLKGADWNVMKGVLEHISLCGYGIFEIKRFGKESVINLRNSSNASRHRSDKPGCYVMAGYLAGIMELITGKECLCLEDKCISKGDGLCTFNIKVLPEKSEPVREFWKSSVPRDADESFVEYDDKGGEVFFKGVTSTVNARQELCEFQKELQRIVGPAYKTIIFEVIGKGSAGTIASHRYKLLIKVMRVFSKRMIIKRLAGEFGHWGLGIAEVLDFDEKNYTARISVKNSYNAMGYKKTKEPVCYVIAGLFSSGGSLIFGRKMGCRETKCVAKGDDHCEFEFFPEK